MLMFFRSGPRRGSVADRDRIFRESAEMIQTMMWGVIAISIVLTAILVFVLISIGMEAIR